MLECKALGNHLWYRPLSCMASRAVMSCRRKKRDTSSVKRPHRLTYRKSSPPEAYAMTTTRCVLVSMTCDCEGVGIRVKVHSSLLHTWGFLSELSHEADQRIVIKIAVKS